MNAFDMSPRDFQLYLDERGYTGDQRDDLLRRYRRANSPFAGIFDFIEGLRGGDEEAGLRRGEIAPMVFPEGMSGFEAFTTGQARPAVPGFLLGGAEAAASAVDAPSAAAAGLIPAQDAAMEALGTAGFAMGAGGAAVRPAGSVGMGGRVADALPDPRNEAEAMAKQVLEMRAAGRAGDVTEEMMAAVAETPTGIRAYHGSPHDFPSAVRVLDKETGRTYVQEADSPVARGLLSQQPDRYSIIEENPLGMFDFSKMGTGEGAQAYGWGGYLAEAEPVARGYRDQLSRGNTSAARRALEAADGDVDRAIQDVESKLRRLEERAALGDFGGDERRFAAQMQIQSDKIQQLKGFKETGEFNAGRMYEVNIDANPEAFLDWDKPLRDQPKIAGIMGYADPDEIAAAKRAAYAEFSAPTGDTFEDLFAPLSPAEQAAAERLSTMPAPWGNMTGKDAYYALQSQGFREGAVGANLPQPNPMKKADKWASEWLKARGVPGIKYFDAMSRGAGEGSRNYVVFDENLINIVRKYGIAGAAAVLGVSVADVEAAMAQAQPAPRTPGLLVQ